MNYEDYFIERGSRFPKYPLNVGLIPCGLTDKALGPSLGMTVYRNGRSGHADKGARSQAPPRICVRKRSAQQQ